MCGGGRGRPDGRTRSRMKPRSGPPCLTLAHTTKTSATGELVILRIATDAQPPAAESAPSASALGSAQHTPQPPEPGLGAVQDVASFDGTGVRLHAARVAPVVRLGQAERADQRSLGCGRGPALRSGRALVGRRMRGDARDGAWPHPARTDLGPEGTWPAVLRCRRRRWGTSPATTERSWQTGSRCRPCGRGHVQAAAAPSDRGPR